MGDITEGEYLAELTLPSMPESLLVIDEEQRREEPDTERIASIIAEDVALAAAVLRTVNSPAFGLRRPIGSIPNAVMLLGLNNVLNLTRAAALRETLGEPPGRERFWDTAHDVANVAAAIARRYTGIPADAAYTLGLFHDCGIPILLQCLSNYEMVLAAAYTQEQESVTAFEARHLPTDHATVGYRVAKEWKLPPELAEAIRYHHACEEADGVDWNRDAHIKTMMAILNLAEHVSNVFRAEVFRSGEPDLQWARVEEKVLAHLAIGELEFIDLRDSLVLMLGES